MKKMNLIKLVPALAAGLSVFSSLNIQAAFIPLGRTNYFQNFDSLVSSGKSKTLPSGWSAFYPGNMNGYIYADNGSSSQGHIYSYGSSGSSERALGALYDPSQGSQTPIFGANFQNTGSRSISRLNISYTGEEWRLGAQGRGPGELEFQYSLNAGSLTSGSWVNAPQLNFLTPNLTGVGAHNGDLAANQTQLSGSIGFLNIPVGATFWVRWVDLAVGRGPQDGLAIDNFSISAVPEASTWAAACAATGLLGLALWRRRGSLRLNFA